MPGACHTGRTLPAGPLSGNIGAVIKPKIDFPMKAAKNAKPIRMCRKFILLRVHIRYAILLQTSDKFEAGKNAQ